MNSVYILTALNSKTRNWILDNVGVQEWQFVNVNSIAVEHRYIDDIIEGMCESNLIENTDYEMAY
jgi:hypothetical protein